MDNLYHVRQYHPNYCDLEDTVVHNISYDKILECYWFKNFEHEYDGGFDKFIIEAYHEDELIGLFRVEIYCRSSGLLGHTMI